MGTVCGCCAQDKDAAYLLEKSEKSRHNTESKESEEGFYEPPSRDELSRLSLPVHPGQTQLARASQGLPGQHIDKEGWLKKQGHIRKSWKKRYFVLSKGVLRYYKHASPNKEERGRELKGYVELTGATIEEVVGEGGQRHIRVIPTEEQKDLLLDAQSDDLRISWVQALLDEIRACNIDSLASGERIPRVVDWYESQHKKFRDALDLVIIGQLFQLHVKDDNNFSHVIACWIHTTQEQDGLLFKIPDDSDASGGSTGATSYFRQQYDGHVIPFHVIQGVMYGSEEPFQPSGRLGHDAVCFTIITPVQAYVFEVESEHMRSQWVKSIASILGFIIIPPPRERNYASSSSFR